MERSILAKKVQLAPTSQGTGSGQKIYYGSGKPKETKTEKPACNKWLHLQQQALGEGGRKRVAVRRRREEFTMSVWNESPSSAGNSGIYGGGCTYKKPES